ncbi:hypothetical protein JCM3263A_13810 [Thermobifida fusca]|jgi:hypothetical protein
MSLKCRTLSRGSPFGHDRAAPRRLRRGVRHSMFTYSYPSVRQNADVVERFHPNRLPCGRQGDDSSTHWQSSEVWFVNET